MTKGVALLFSHIRLCLWGFLAKAVGKKRKFMVRCRTGLLGDYEKDWLTGSPHLCM